MFIAIIISPQLVKKYLREEENNITIDKFVSQPIEFAEEEISLQMPVEGSGDWRLQCLIPPVVRYYSNDVCMHDYSKC